MLPYLLKRTDASVEGAGRTGRCHAAFSGCSGLTSGKAAFCCSFSSAAVLVPCSSNSFPWRRHGGSWRGPAWKSSPMYGIDVGSLFQIKLTCSVLPRQMVFLSAVSSLTDRLQRGSVGFSSCWAWGIRMTVKAYGVNSSGSGARRFSATARTSRLTFSASRPSESRLVCAFNRAKASRLSLLSRHQETQSSRG